MIFLQTNRQIHEDDGHHDTEREEYSAADHRQMEGLISEESCVFNLTDHHHHHLY